MPDLGWRGLTSAESAPDPLVSSRRRGVRVVDGAALEKRSAQAAWVRIPPSPPPTPGPGTSKRALAGSGFGSRNPAVRSPGPCRPPSRGHPNSGLDGCPTPRRGRLVDYGAALEMRFGATRRGFESRPLRHFRPPSGRPSGRRAPAVLTHAPSKCARSVLVARLRLPAHSSPGAPSPRPPCPGRPDSRAAPPLARARGGSRHDQRRVGRLQASLTHPWGAPAPWRQ